MPPCHGTGCFFAWPRSYATKSLGFIIPKNILPKSFEASKWHWLILAPIGALVYICSYLLPFLVQRISLYTAKLTILFNYKELHFFTYGFIALHDSASAALMCVSFPKNTLPNIFYIICSKKSRVTSCKRQKS